MDGLTLLAEARAHGLEVAVKGDKLVIRGPRRAAAVAERLLAYKLEIMRLVQAPDSTDTDTSPLNPDKNSPCVSVSNPSNAEPDGWWGPVHPGELLIEPAEITPCPRCNSLVKWQPAVGESRCMKCDPPTAALRFLERAKQIRLQQGIEVGPAKTTPSQPHCRRCFSTHFVDTRIHGGRSIRRDCAQCGLTAGFPVWFGKIDERFGTS